MPDPFFNNVGGRDGEIGDVGGSNGPTDRAIITENDEYLTAENGDPLITE